MPKKIIEQDEAFYKLAHTIADEIDTAISEYTEGEESDYNFEDLEEALEFSETYDDLLGTIEEILEERGILVGRSIVEEGPEDREVIEGEEGEEGEREDED
jgi:frataxin-like iron-binding protein CyaY